MNTEATDTDLAMMQRAMALCEKAAAMDEVPVGAVVYIGDRILGEAHNLRETTHDPTAHAEILAMRQAAEALGNWRLDDCTVLVTLEPCPMCAGAMVNARVPRVVYGCADPKMGCVDTLHQLCTEPRFNHRLEVVSGLMAEECAEVLRAFFRKKRKTKPA